MTYHVSSPSLHDPQFLFVTAPFLAVCVLLLGIPVMALFRSVSTSSGKFFTCVLLTVLSLGLAPIVSVNSLPYWLSVIHGSVASFTWYSEEAKHLFSLLFLTILWLLGTLLIVNVPKPAVKAAGAPYRLRLRRTFATGPLSGRRAICAPYDPALSRLTRKLCGDAVSQHERTGASDVSLLVSKANICDLPRSLACLDNKRDAALTVQLDELRVEGASKADRIRELDGILALARLSISEKDKVLAERDATITSLEAVVQGLHAAVESAQTSAAAKEEELVALKSTLDASVSSNQTAIEELVVKIAKFEGELQAAQAEVKAKISLLDDLNNTLDAACERIFEKDTTISEKDTIIAGQEDVIKDLKTAHAVPSDEIVAQLEAKIESLELEMLDKKLDVHRVRHAHDREMGEVLRENSEAKTTVKRLEATISRQTKELANKISMIESRNDKIAELTRACAVNATTASSPECNQAADALFDWNTMLADAGLCSNAPSPSYSWRDAWLYDDFSSTPHSVWSYHELAAAEEKMAKLTHNLSRTQETLEHGALQFQACNTERLELAAKVKELSVAPEDAARFSAQAEKDKKLAEIRDAANAELDKLEEEMFRNDRWRMITDDLEGVWATTVLPGRTTESTESIMTVKETPKCAALPGVPSSGPTKVKLPKSRVSTSKPRDAVRTIMKTKESGAKENRSLMPKVAVAPGAKKPTPVPRERTQASSSGQPRRPLSSVSRLNMR